MSTRFNKLLKFWEEGPPPRGQQQRDEKVTEELAAIPNMLDTSAVDEQQQRRQPPIVPTRPQRPPWQPSNQPPQATQLVTPPLTPERDAFQENGCKAPSEVFELGVAEQLTPNASIYSSCSIREATTQRDQVRQSPSTNETSAIQKIQPELQEVKLQVQQLRSERAERDQVLACLQSQLRDLQDRYARALETASLNDTELTALRNQLRLVREQEQESRSRQAELERDLRTAMQRERELGDQNDDLLKARARPKRRRRSSGASKEKGRHKTTQPPLAKGMGCFCM